MNEGNQHEHFNVQPTPLEKDHQTDQKFDNPNPGELLSPHAATDPSVNPEAEGFRAVENTDLVILDESETKHFATNDHRDKQENGRWDKKKAETLGAVLSERDEENPNDFDKAIKSRDERFQVIEEHEELTRERRSEADELVNTLKAREAGGDETTKDDFPFIDEDIRYKIEQIKKRSAEDKIFEKAQRGRARDEVDKVVKELIYPLEELYDLNPDHFANMPTSEFIQLGKEYSKLDLDTRNADHGLVTASHFMDDVRSAIKRKAKLRDEWILTFSNQARRNSVIEDNIWQQIELEEKFAEARKDSFDKSPKQIMEEYAGIVEEYVTLAETKKLAADQTKQDFLDQFKPHEDATENS